MKVLIRTDIDSPSGYSVHARGLIDALSLIDEIDLKIEQRKHDTSTVNMPPARVEFYRALASKEWTKPDVLIHFETPEFYDPVPGCFNIGFTVWETTKIPSTDMGGQTRMNWVYQMNRMDEIWTASTDSAEAYERSGVDIPIEIFTGPVDTDFYKPGMDELPILGLTVDQNGNTIARKDRPFVIGFMGQWTKRKNIEGWLVWLMTQFAKDKVVGLLKTYGSHLDQHQTQPIYGRINAVRNQISSEVDGAGIICMTEKLTDKEVAQWFQSVDMYVSFSRGEGYALPVVQAMACGVPVAHTNWGGPKDYITHDQSGLLLPCTMEPVYGMTYNPWYRSDQWWAAIDMMRATDIIVNVLSDQDRMKRLGAAAREAAVEKCSVRSLASQLASRFAELHLSKKINVQEAD